MDQAKTQGVAGVLQRWNPLGAAANRVIDLNGHETDTADIIACVSLGSQGPEQAVRTVINQAFDLDLSLEECRSPTAEISSILR